MRKIIFSIFTILLTISAFTQPCDTIATICETHIATNFISDGQSYRALLVEDEVAEFHTTLYGNSTYRLVGCSGMEDGNLIYTIYDKDRNMLFSNEDYENSPYWDFQITSTLDCIIEAQLDINKVGSGCAVLLIAFEN